MLKNVSKLAGLFILLVLSFVYTDKVFSSARSNDPVMKEVMGYKEKNDLKPVEPKITDDEIILGHSGLVVNAKESYNSMKSDAEFSEEKVVFDNKLPDRSISKTYDYYIKQGNSSKKHVSIIFKINDETDIDSLLKAAVKYNVSFAFFVDGAWLEKNIETGFSISNMGYEIYNLGYDGKYSKNMISVTNNLVESISLKDSRFCLNETKNEDAKEICKKKKMYTILPTLIEPNITSLKESLTSGAIISYDGNNFDSSKLGIIIKTITSRGYEIKLLSQIIKE